MHMAISNPMTVQRVVSAGPVIPVIVIDQLEDALPLAHAVLAGGVQVLEVTLRTPAALKAIEQIRTHYPDAIVGAGTLKNSEDVRAAVDHGAQFGVSPGLTARIADACHTLQMPLLPGVATATDVLSALDMGFKVLKLFPAETVGGLGLLKAFGSVFPDVSFCPTGGLTEELAPRYLALKNVVCVGGSWFVPAQSIADKRWDHITALTHIASQLRAP